MRILALSTWFPYPPNQGSTIRAYYLLKGLAQQHEVALVSFEDQPVQPAWVDHMRQICARVDVVHRRPFAREFGKSKLGMLSLTPSAVFASQSAEMAAAAHNAAVEWGADLVVALTFVTAPYALQIQNVQRVVDVDNLTAPMLYEHYQMAQRPLERLRRYLAYAKFRRYESRLFRHFNLCLVVSERDTQVIASYVPLQPSQIGLVPNGVDLDHYHANRYPRADNTLIYSGALTYHANYDAMEYFLGQIFPLITAALPEVRLTITGSTDGVARHNLPSGGRVTFTGFVEDIRPHVGGSSVCIVPLRQGAGTRLKILEAMALGTPVVSTSKGAEGLAVETGRHLLLADSPADFAAATLRMLQDEPLRARLSGNARRRVEECYSWTKIRGDFGSLISAIAQ